jgi:hypothetical protein
MSFLLEKKKKPTCSTLIAGCMSPCYLAIMAPLSCITSFSHSSELFSSDLVSLILKNHLPARSWWLKPIILAIHEAEIRRIQVQSQPGQIVHETLSQK